MLLIHCPYCEEERSELEFRNAGEAHIARPADIAAISDERFRGILLPARQSEGPASSSAGGTSMAARASSMPRATRHRQVHHHLQGRRAEAGHRCHAGLADERPPSRPMKHAKEMAPMSGAQPHCRRGPPDAGEDRALHLRRQALHGARGRHAGLGAARQRRPSRRPLVQVSPPARHPVGRRGGAERAGRRRARRGAQAAERAGHRAGALSTASTASSQNRWPSLAFDVGAVNDLLSPILRRRLLLQDLHVAEGCLEEHLRAEDPRRRRSRRRARPKPIPTTMPAAMPIATCWWSAPALPASRQHSPPPRPARGSSSATSRRSSAARCASRAARRSTGRTAMTGRRRPSRELAAMDNVRVLTRTTAFGYYAQNFVGLAERVTDHLAKPGRDLPRERLWQVRARRVVLATGAIERHMVFAEQRPAGHHARVGRRAPISTTTASRSATKVGVYTANDSAYAGGVRPEAGGRRRRRDRRLPRRPGRRRAGEARALGIEVLPGHAVISARPASCASRR